MLVKIKSKLRKLEVDYSSILGDWINLFPTRFLEGEYMKNLLSFLFASYTAGHDCIRPARDKVFNAFKACTYMDCKVIFVTEFPTQTFKGNGIGLGNLAEFSDGFLLTPQIKALQTCIEETYYNGFRVSWNTTLQDLTDQGVLFLNTALTCTTDDKEAHTLHWEPFISELINNISDKTSNIVFVFIGDACRYAPLVDEKNHEVLMETLSIEECITKKEIWMSDIFNELNDTLFHMHGTTGMLLL